MNNTRFMEKAKKAVVDWYGAEGPAPEEVYIVWFCKTLQNWKALLSTDFPDKRYFEATYNGDKGEMYLDTYKKEDNTVVKDEEDNDE